MVRGKWQSGHCCRTVTAIVGVLLTILMLVPATAQTKNIFWTDRVARKIQRANLDGTGITDLTTGIMHQYILAVDATNNKVYWTESANFKIGRANLDGTGVEENLITGVNRSFGINLDVAGGKLYWSEDSNPGKIGRANLDGTGQEYIISGDANLAKYPKYLALDLTNNKIYYRSNRPNNSDYVIKRANLDGTGVEDRVTGLLNDGVEGIALDLAGGKIYWSARNHPNERIRRANLDGTGKENLVTGLNDPRGLVLDLGNNKMYWVDAPHDGRPKKIQRANLDGTGVEDIVSLSMGEGITIATITSSNGGPGVDGSSSGTDDIRYVPFKSKYFLMTLVALLGGWWVYRRC